MPTEEKESLEVISLSLAGTWSLRLDPDDIGEVEQWYLGGFSETVCLPGSLDENGIGEPNHEQDFLGGLSRKFKYTGAAWYVKEVQIPKEWLGSELELELERVHWFSSVWINGERIGDGESLNTSHRYSFNCPDSGCITVAARIDNTPHIPIGRICHGISDWTQTNWNGVVGQITLAKVDVGVSPFTCRSLEEGMRVMGCAQPGDRVFVTALDYSTELTAGEDGLFDVTIPKDELKTWSDHSPSLFELSARTSYSTRVITTGYRSMATAGKTITLNGKPTYLRGTLENCVFPRTGYPSTDKAEWLRILGKVKEYGLNHVRFHSWCPPEAAFAAADEIGILFQVELSLWTGKWAVSSHPELMAWCRREAFRTLEAYGNHPSLVMFSLGNEMSFYGEEPDVDQLLKDLKAAYPHVLYTFSSHGTHLSGESQFYVQADNGKPGEENLPLRGSTWFGVGSRFDREVPASTSDCSPAAKQFDRPVISHEVGEWAVYPDLQNEANFDGVLEARNFAFIKAQLTEKGMGDQVEDFVHASGKLSASLYKEEIETLFRTEELAGFQLLGLSDFPGQGTATIGMLDAFWNEKGFVNGSQFKEFCSDTVPLLATSKFVWKSSEAFKAEVRAFHSGEEVSASARWELRNDQGIAMARGETEESHLKSGRATFLGNIEIDLSRFTASCRYEIVIFVGDLGVNRWNIWVFDESVPDVSLDQIEVFKWYREDTRKALKAGKTVWLRMNPNDVWMGLPGRYASAFWSPIHFKEQVGTMGCLIQKDHPMFGNFPTESYTEWHWWEILTRSKALCLDSFPKGFRPALQVIDRYERNNKLGTILEAKVGEGRLLISFIDFDSAHRPAAAQLEASIKKYLASSASAVLQKVSFAELDEVFRLEP
jgi:hypothetical protein